MRIVQRDGVAAHKHVLGVKGQRTKQAEVVPQLGPNNLLHALRRKRSTSVASVMNEGDGGKFAKARKEQSTNLTLFAEARAWNLCAYR